MSTLWSDRPPVEAPQRHPTDTRYEHVVVGGGITGIATAVMLAESGAGVAVLEARHLGAGATGHTTAKLSVLQGTRLTSIAKKHDSSAVRGYVAANLDAQRWLLDLLRAHDVPFQSRTAYTYAQTEKGIGSVDSEFRLAREAGLPVERLRRLDAPFPTVAAVALAEQAQFDPMDVLRALVRQAQRHGVDVFEGTRVRGVRSDGDDQVLATDQGEVRCGTVILATGTPILDRGGYFARLHPQRSYSAAFDVSEELPAGMYLSVDQPSRSIRTAPTADGEVLLTGGAGHTVGRTRSEQQLVDELLSWTHEYFPTARLRARWSAQDYETMDELPYVGPLLPGHDRVLVATGFAKWGMSNGVAAALALSGRLRGIPPSWSNVLDSARLRQISGLPSAAIMNGSVGVQMVKGWVGAALGKVDREGLRPVGACTVDGHEYRVSAICPHLYGVLKWNDTESSWDCPLHGSRFGYDGTLLEGPATSDLRRLD